MLSKGLTIFGSKSKTPTLSTAAKRSVFATLAPKKKSENGLRLEKISHVATSDQLRVEGEASANFGNVCVVRGSVDTSGVGTQKRLELSDTEVDTLFLLLCDTENFRVKALPLHLVHRTATAGASRSGNSSGNTTSSNGTGGGGLSGGMQHLLSLHQVSSTASLSDAADTRLYVGHIRSLTETAGWPCAALLLNQHVAGEREPAPTGATNETTRVSVLETVANERREGEVNLCVSVYAVKGSLKFELPIAHRKRPDTSSYSRIVDEFFKHYTRDSTASIYDFTEPAESSNTAEIWEKCSSGMRTGVERSSLLLHEGDGAWFGALLALVPNSDPTESFATASRRAANPNLIAAAHGFDALYDMKPAGLTRRTSLRRENSLSTLPTPTSTTPTPAAPEKAGVLRLLKQHQLGAQCCDVASGGNLVAVLLKDAVVRIYDRTFRLLGTIELNSLNHSESRANGSTPWWTSDGPALSPPSASPGSGKSGAGPGSAQGAGRVLKQCYKVLITADHRLLVADLTSRAVHAFALDIPDTVLQQQPPQPQHGLRTIAAAAVVMAGADSILQQMGRPAKLELNEHGASSGGEAAPASGKASGNGEAGAHNPESDAQHQHQQQHQQQHQEASQINVRRIGCVLTEVVVGGWALDPSNGDVYIFDLCSKSLDMYKLLQS